MFHASVSRRLLLAAPLYLSTLALAFVEAPPALAQDANAPVAALSQAAAQEKADAKALADLQRELAPLEKTAPAQALTRYREFARSRPALGARAQVTLADAIAQLQLNGLNDAPAALATYDAALESLNAEPSSLRLLIESSAIRIASGDAAGAERAIRARRARVLEAPPAIASPVWQQLARALTQQGKKAELIQMLEEVLVEAPEFLDDGTQSRPNREQSLDAFLLAGTGWGWMYDALEDALLESGQNDRALGWAKARYQVALTSSGALDRATRSLARAAMAKDPSGALAYAMAGARAGDNIAPDPLRAIALPAALQTVKFDETMRNRDRCGVLIARGEFERALAEAAQNMVARPTSASGALDVARVFKAIDLHTERANQWLEFARVGRGANPLPAFYNGAAPAIATPAAIAGASALAGSTPALQKLRLLDEAASRVPFKVALLKAGKLAPAAAWESGALSDDELVYMLRWGGIVDGEGQTANKKLRIELAGLLAEGAPQFAQFDGDNQNVLLAVSDYYRERRDPRAGTLLERMLNEGEAKSVGGKAVPRAWYYEPALNRLAEFYRAQGEPQKARLLYEREAEQTRETDGIEASVANLEAARLAILAGDNVRAGELYARVVNGDYAWTAGLALWDQANALIERGQHEKARELLLRPLNGPGADKARVGLQALLALSFYRTGEIEPARAAARASLSAFATSEPREGRGVMEQAASARELLTKLDGWEKSPIQLERPELRFTRRALQAEASLSNAKDAPLVRYVRVKTLADEPLLAISDNPAIEVQMLDESIPDAFAVVRELQIAIAPSALRRDFKAQITVRSATDAKRAVILPVVVADE